MRAKTKKTIKRMSWIAFFIYLCLMVYFLFICERLGRVPNQTYRYNIVPFEEIRRFWNYRESIGLNGVLLNLAGNVVCFIPLGFVLPVLSNRRLKFFSVLFISCTTSVMVELIQLYTKLGSCDVDDVILNTCGGIVGYILFAICNAIYCFVNKLSKRK